MKTWIYNHALLVRAVLVVACLVWIIFPMRGCFVALSEDFQKERDNPTMPPNVLVHSDEAARVKQHVDSLYLVAKNKGSNYGLKSYRQDLISVYRMERDLGMPYHLGGLGWDHYQLRRLHNLCNDNLRKGHAPQEELEADEELDVLRVLEAEFREDGQVEIYLAGVKLNSYLVGLLIIYFKIMLFCLLWFPLRLLDGELSHKTTLREEFLLAPGRFIRAVVLWPAWFKVYGKFTDPAKALRFARLKVEYLRQKSGLEQLTPSEEEMLRRQAEQPLEEFEQALESLKAQEAVVKRSLATAFLWFLLGFFLSPFISPRSRFYQGASVCSNFVVQIMIDNALDTDCEKNEAPSRAPPEFERQAIVEWFELPKQKLRLARIVLREQALVLKEVIRAIDHVPRRFDSFYVAFANGGS